MEAILESQGIVGWRVVNLIILINACYRLPYFCEIYDAPAEGNPFLLSASKWYWLIEYV
jgi:hypothetical protein